VKGRGYTAARGDFGRTALVVVLAVALLAGAVFLLFRDRLPTADPAANVILQQGGVTRTDVGWIVRVDVENTGTEPVVRLYVVGALSDGRRTLESSEAIIGVLPPGARQRAALVFRTDPTGRRLLLSTRSPAMR
jgi:uncharacterized protein (TIGR02588 family)